MLRRTLLLMAAGLLTVAGSAAAQLEPTTGFRQSTYATTPQGELQIHVVKPARMKASDRRPAIVLFHGGGWNRGKPGQFYVFGKHLAGRGMVVVMPEYRLKNDHGTTPAESIQDAFTAMRHVRQNAESMGIDPNRIAAGGGSAGGHLAAALATVDPADFNSGDSDVSTMPNALVLFNPVYDNSPDGYGSGRFDDWQKASPLHNIHADMPPTLVLLGDEDNLIPVSTAKAFQAKQKEAGVRSELIIYEGEGHGFFNRNPAQDQTQAAMDAFLVSLGWLETAK
jgi:acetyl esterase/lipase